MSPSELQAISERAEKATAGPWLVMGNNVMHEQAPGRHSNICSPRGEKQGANTVFIANARQDIPALLSMIQELEAKANKWERTLHTIAYYEKECYDYEPLDTQAAEDMANMAAEAIEPHLFGVSYTDKPA